MSQDDPKLSNLIDSLLYQSSGPIGTQAPPIFANKLGSIGRQLDHILMIKNGLYALSDSILIRPSGSSNSILTIEEWNSSSLWRNLYPNIDEEIVFFGEDVFGIQFCVENDHISSFDPETGNIEGCAENIEEWIQLVLTNPTISGVEISKKWARANGPIAPGFRLIPSIPFVCGGEFALSNLRPMDDVAGMRVRAGIAESIRDLPDGETFQFFINE